MPPLAREAGAKASTPASKKASKKMSKKAKGAAVGVAATPGAKAKKKSKKLLGDSKSGASAAAVVKKSKKTGAKAPPAQAASAAEDTGDAGDAGDEPAIFARPASAKSTAPFAAALPDGAEAQNTSETAEVLAKLKTHMAQISSHNKAVAGGLEKGKIVTEQGVSLLEAKLQLMMSYNIALNLYILLKLEGKPIENHPVIDKLILLRTMIEKIKPIETRLKYQIDKLIRTTTVESAKAVQGKVDPLQHKPNAANLQPKLHDDSQQGGDDDGAQVAGGDGLYAPPKISAQHYEEDESAAYRREKRAAKERSKLATSEMMQELRSEFSTQPEEISHADAARQSDKAEREERTKHEEENFIRLGGFKKLNKKSKRIANGMEKITEFAGLRGLESGRQAAGKSMRDQMNDVRKKRQKKRR